MQLALADARTNPEEVGYVNAHGTSTPLGDKVETLAIKKVFSQHAYRLAVSSTKSMLGHTLGASGGIAAIACSLTLQHGVIHPTINYETPDPDCDLDYVPNTAREARVRRILINNFGKFHLLDYRCYPGHLSPKVRVPKVEMFRPNCPR